MLQEPVEMKRFTVKYSVIHEREIYSPDREHIQELIGSGQILEVAESA